MRINQKVLSIPPYLSTSWKNIVSLRAEEKGNDISLFITLIDGTQTEVPHMQKQVVDAIFAAHAKFFDMETPSSKASAKLPSDPSPPAFSLKMGLPGLEGLSSVLMHNQKEYGAPNLPSDILEKISSLTQSMKPEEIDAIPQPEPHCNCPHCQITRAIHQGACYKEETLLELEEELVSEEDLHFRDWDIKQSTDQIYQVINPLDSEEHYNVFLGSPIGCTCGSKSCEHIKAVLSS